MSEKVFIAADHGGFEVKQQLVDFIRSEFNDIETEDGGTDSSDSVDYPDFAAKVAQSVSIGEVDRGILICERGSECVSRQISFPVYLRLLAMTN